MAVPIKLKRSAVQGKVPGTADLELGEIAINTYDGKMFIKREYTDGYSTLSEIVNVNAVSPTGLEQITENGNTGWRLIGKDPTKYNGIGNQAVDFSEPNPYSTSGASGSYSFSAGYGVVSSGNYSATFGREVVASGSSSFACGYGSQALSNNAVAFGGATTASKPNSFCEGEGTIAQNNAMHAEGMYNIGTATDTIHETGIGTTETNRKNAFEIYTDGRVTAPELTTTLIDGETTGRVLTTREWVQANTINSVSRTVEKLNGDGTTTAFTLTNLYNVGFETLVDVYVDGLLKIEGSADDYTLSNGDTLTFNTAPSNGSIIIVKILS